MPASGILARLDSAGGAGIRVPPAQMPIFGSPSNGTPILSAAPRAGLGLPLKALAWADGAGSVAVSFNAPRTSGPGMASRRGSSETSRPGAP